jgi:hypothetical protein
VSLAYGRLRAKIITIVQKDAAYARLVGKLKKVEPSANKDSVVKKINNIRSNYRKELKGVIKVRVRYRGYIPTKIMVFYANL